MSSGRWSTWNCGTTSVSWRRCSASRSRTTTRGLWRSLGSEHTHDPVLVAEVTAHLRPGTGGVFVDATVGLGGHARALVEAGADRLIGIDRDEAALAEARQHLASLADRIDFVHADYREIGQELQSRGLTEVRGILADLGVSSMQFDDPARGFS